MGQTALKTKDVLNAANGGILFIDEAYSLVGTGSDFGQEAIDTLLKYMEDNRSDFVVIAAGYKEKMVDFVASNPGLQSRFNKYINFDDYTDDELYAIFLNLAVKHHFYYDDEVAKEIFRRLQLFRTESSESFSNARLARNFFESIMQSQANRVSTIVDSTSDDLQLITVEDVYHA